jgi:hypothetical protein
VQCGHNYSIKSFRPFLRARRLELVPRQLKHGWRPRLQLREAPKTRLTWLQWLRCLLRSPRSLCAPALTIRSDCSARALAFLGGSPETGAACFVSAFSVLIFCRSPFVAAAAIRTFITGAKRRQGNSASFCRESFQGEEARAGVARAGVEVTAGRGHRAMAKRGLD